jgi:hypothetical protein
VQRIWNLLVQNGGFLPAARWFHGFSEANGKLFVFGGMGNSGTQAPDQVAFKFVGFTLKSRLLTKKSCRMLL